MTYETQTLNKRNLTTKRDDNTTDVRVKQQLWE